MSDSLVTSLTGPDELPVLVLGNSLGTSSLVWDRQAAAFAERFRLLRYELPGHGGAPAWTGEVSVASLGAGVLDALDRYGVERAAYCGISLGGMTGMWLAAHAPDRIDALGLVCTSSYLPPASGWQARASLVLASGMAPVVEPSIGRWFTPSFAASAPLMVSVFADELLAADPEGYASCCLAVGAMDLRADLGAIMAPTVVISGAQDQATPPSHGAAIADSIAGARQLVVDGAHLANVASPGLVGSALIDLLSVTIR
jgi:3-oxoadipate enol-lactonase